MKFLAEYPYNTIPNPATRSQASYYPARFGVAPSQNISIHQETFGSLRAFSNQMR
jgi:hypothetical protein